MCPPGVWITYIEILGKLISVKDVRYGLISKFDIFRFDMGSYSIIRFDSIRYFHLIGRKSDSDDKLEKKP